MKLQDVLLKAMAKKITWWQAAEILGISDRHMRRWRERYEEEGYNGLLDRRGHSWGDDENAGATGCEKDARWKSHKADFPTFAWKSRKRRGIPTFPQPLVNAQNRTFHLQRKADI